MKGLGMTILIILVLGCFDRKGESFPIPRPQTLPEFSFPDISYEEYHNKILGFLVGSAIGDAMGSPVEMWSAGQIEDRFGFIDKLIINSRASSAEGPWGSNMPAGTGTDDTRWKYLFGKYLLGQSRADQRSETFAHFIQQQYEGLKRSLDETDSFDADKLEVNIKYLQWLQEWAIVANAYLSGDIDRYNERLAKFYGGEMACAGLLYAPLLGMLYPGDPLNAYLAGWDHSIFDLGYAKDLTSMSAALTAAAMTYESVDSILNLHQWVDPKNYTDSRLIGRICNQIHEGALAAQRKDLIADSVKGTPDYFLGDTMKHKRMLATFQSMDPHLKSIPFHADEIYRISLNALAFSGGNFMDAMVFITNYGRDNDTVGAVAGGILGAFTGYTALPDKMCRTVIDAHRDILNIDLESLAEDLAMAFYVGRD